jgi:antitoxin (DNA-binding transcriptional repressor) of toxin-antitoxin stability system
MLTVRIRDLGNDLDGYIRRLKPGEAIAILDGQSVVAELRAPTNSPGDAEPHGSRYSKLVASGIIRPAVDSGDPLAAWPAAHVVKLSPGSVSTLIDDDRSA